MITTIAVAHPRAPIPPLKWGVSRERPVSDASAAGGETRSNQ
jgi:hypothetical protein